jgi:hypothetical protein
MPTKMLTTSVRIYDLVRHWLAHNLIIGIRANPNIGDTGFSNGINSAILRYDGAPTSNPTTIQTTSTAPLHETDLHVSKPLQFL